MYGEATSLFKCSLAPAASLLIYKLCARVSLTTFGKHQDGTRSLFRLDKPLPSRLQRGAEEAASASPLRRQSTENHPYYLYGLILPALAFT